jgi:agmatine deiminase
VSTWKELPQTKGLPSIFAVKGISAGGFIMMRCTDVNPLLIAVAIQAAALLVFPMTGVHPAQAIPQSDPVEVRVPQEPRTEELPIHLTEEEMTRLDEIGTYHVSTAPPPTPIRKCAQWEPLTGVLIRYNYGFGLPYELIQEYAEDLTVHILCRSSQQSSCWSNLESHGVNMDNVDLIDIVTNSMWTRDYGPQTIFADGVWSFADHDYNRPRPDDDEVPWELGTEWGCSVYGTGLVHTGGNFLYDGHGTGFSTDLVWDENPGLTHQEIAGRMEDYVGITNYVILPDISSTGIHHIDCWAKLLNEETILVKEVSPSHPHYDDLEANVATLETLTNCYGRPYNIVRIYCGSIGGSDVAAYTNSMIVNNKVFVPLYGISTDAAAIATYQAAMPGYEVLGYEDGWLSDDAIHCRTMEIPDRYMLVVDTNPLQDRASNDGDYRVTAFIDDRNETGLVTDSLLVWWRLEGSPAFDAVVMQATADPDSYYADIPNQADLADVEYYVFAKDNSGRRETRPMVAPDAWYSFNTGESEPICDVAPGSLDFGTVILGEYLDTTFTITNTGGGTLSGTVTETCDHYQITSGGGPYSLGADESVVVTVRFEPAIGGSLYCTVETGTDCNDVSCSGFCDDQSSVREQKIPTAFMLAQNSPNPFSPVTEIRYELPVDCHVRLDIYSVLGKRVATLVDQHQTAGYRSVHWDSRTRDGRNLPGGIYLYRLQTGDYIQVRKMVLLE